MRTITKRTFCLMLLVFLSLAAVQLSASNIGTVRYMEVMAAHPRMLKFDFAARRFSDGPSAQVPLETLRERGRELEKKLQELTSEQENTLAGFEKKLAAPEKAKSQAEKDFWAKKQNLDREIETLRDQIAANIAAMEFGGRTIETLVLPEVNRIMADVNAAVAAAAKGRGCTMVLVEPFPDRPNDNSDNWIEESWSAHLRGGQSSDPAMVRRWISSVNRIIPELGPRINLLKPMLTGSVDLTPDAVKLLVRPQKTGGKSAK